MQSSNEHYRDDPVMGIGSFCVDLDIFPSDHGQRDRGSEHAVKT